MHKESNTLTLCCTGGKQIYIPGVIYLSNDPIKLSSEQADIARVRTQIDGYSHNKSNLLGVAAKFREMTRVVTSLQLACKRDQKAP